jgi:mRNA-degrading endonuclease RelE of RelBE toxin-antitoxin system
VNYEVAITHEAEKSLDRLMERRIRARMVQLAEDPFEPRLSAPLRERGGVRRSRVGG